MLIYPNPYSLIQLCFVIQFSDNKSYSSKTLYFSEVLIVNELYFLEVQYVIDLVLLREETTLN